MKNSLKLDKIVNGIDWETVYDYHKKLNILWDIKNKDGSIDTRIPIIDDLRDELKSLVAYMDDNDCDYLSYGTWVIFWDSDDPTKLGEIRIIFRLGDYVISDTERNPQDGNYIPYPENGDSLDDLEDQLKSAIKEEDYELAALIRDEIQYLNKKD
jgi:hypothetical protein